MLDRIRIQKIISSEIGRQMGFDVDETLRIIYSDSLEGLNMDSLDIVELIPELELRFGIDFTEDEIDENFKMKSTVREITQFIEKKLGI